MKTKSIILFGLCLLTLSITLSSFISKTTSNNAKTEEYAIVDVIERGKRKYIRVTKGAEPTTEIEWKKEKTDDKDDFTPVISALNQLNEQGFELLNSAIALETISGSSQGARLTYMMVKKIK
jgi:CRISPR/Cas system endoribonuclease Cas6 (RAMP superfamily)